MDNGTYNAFSVSPITDGEGRVDRILVVSRVITELEIGHRLRELSSSPSRSGAISRVGDAPDDGASFELIQEDELAVVQRG